MVIEVPDAVKHKTNGCPRDFACLATTRCGDPEKCKVDYADGKNVLVLASKEHVSCPYRISFGYKHMYLPDSFLYLQQDWRPSKRLNLVIIHSFKQ